MEINGKVWISNQYKAKDYWVLDLSKPYGGDWFKAIDIFRDRIYGRFINQITELNKKPESNGFAAIALCCLLIDAMYQFEYGTMGKMYNKARYKQILREHMPDVFNSDAIAEKFYCDIRCGILHSAETGHGSQLAVGKDYVVCLSPNREYVSVDVVNMADRLKEYVDDYCDRLIAYNSTTRSNFKKKMNYLCERPSFS